MQDMPGMQHSIDHAQALTFINKILLHDTAGTSAQPNSMDEPMIMHARGKWMLMFHGVAFLSALQQSGPRGYDKVFSTNWFMPMAQRQIGRGELTLRTMLSLEPATVTQRFYPLLFQQGETAFGKPTMTASIRMTSSWNWPRCTICGSEKRRCYLFMLRLSAIPAMGPSAYAHRASASEDPVATLGHHFQDSTHIADDVVTGGLAYKNARIEFSGFHGREPDEFRWDIDSGAIDSWSTRLTVQPGQNWSAQVFLCPSQQPGTIASNR